MKLTDFAIIFSILLLTVIVTIEIKMNMMVEVNNHKFTLNNIVDQAVTDSLAKNYKEIDNSGKPIININSIFNDFMDEVNYILYGTHENMSIQEANIPVFIVCDTEGYWIHTDKWTKKKKYFSNNHTERISQLSKDMIKVVEQYGISVDIPLNDGEAWCQTFADYGAYAIYCNDSNKLMNKEYRIFSFSGAAIKLK